MNIVSNYRMQLKYFSQTLHNVDQYIDVHVDRPVPRVDQGSLMLMGGGGGGTRAIGAVST